MLIIYKKNLNVSMLFFSLKILFLFLVIYILIHYCVIIQYVISPNLKKSEYVTVTSVTM